MLRILASLCVILLNSVKVSSISLVGFCFSTLHILKGESKLTEFYSHLQTSNLATNLGSEKLTQDYCMPLPLVALWIIADR